jgi:hypothetical protein
VPGSGSLTGSLAWSPSRVFELSGPEADSQGMSALEKILLLAGSPAAPAEADPAAELLLAAQVAVRELAVFLASDPDDDGDDDSSGEDGGKGDTDDDAGHTGHATFKALKKKGVPDAKAAKMCAQADKKVKASALAESAQVILAGLFDEGSGLVALAAPPGESAAERRESAKKGHALDDGSYPIEDKKHLHSAAVLAASKHGNWQAARALIRKRARELGVELSSLPGFGGSSDKDEKVAATMVALAAKGMDDGGVPMHHGAFNGTHTHSHHLTAAHAHPHQHFGDNNHDGGPQHRQGSKPGQGRFGDY